MASNKLYHTPFAPETIEWLEAHSFNVKEEQVNGDYSGLSIVIDRQDKQFWVSDEENLINFSDYASEDFEEKVLSTTLKEIEQWG